tara:strand:+ start:694 stop:870 length:177 start_codon:yes stop_codon:yes gene_type:complete
MASQSASCAACQLRQLRDQLRSQGLDERLGKKHAQASALFDLPIGLAAVGRLLYVWLN